MCRTAESNAVQAYPFVCSVKNSSISLRSFAYSPLIFTTHRHFAVLCRLQRQLMKWWTNRIAILRWTSLPIFVSSSFAVVIPSERIVLIAIVHTLYLYSCLKLITNPGLCFFLSVGLLTQAYCVPLLPLKELVCVDVVAARKCLLLAMVHGCIVLNCPSLQFPLSEKLDRWCRCCSLL